MPFSDFVVFWRAAQALLRGADPYQLPGVYYPLPFFYIFLPLGTLPLPIAQTIWFLVEAAIFVAILRRQALLVVLFVPVLLTFIMGQIVMPMLGLFALLRSRAFGGIALALLLLKPQLVLFLTPWLLWQWWKSDRRQIVSFVATLTAMTVSAFLIQPDWLMAWLGASGARNRAAISPSLWGMLSFLPNPIWIAAAALVTFAIFIWAWRRNDFDILAVAGFLVNPIIISYDLTLLTILVRSPRIWLALALLSWLTFAMSEWHLNEWPVLLLTTVVLVILVKEKERAAPWGRRFEGDRQAMGILPKSPSGLG